MGYKVKINQKRTRYKREKRDKDRIDAIKKKYSSLILEMQFYTIKEKAIILHKIDKRIRKKIYQHFFILHSDEIEQEIKRKKWRDHESKRSNDQKIKRLESNKKYKEKKFIKKYASLIYKIQSYTILNKAKFLYPIHGLTRLKIYKHFILPFPLLIEKEILKFKNQKYQKKHKPKNKKRIAKNWRYVQNWIINRGCICGEKDINKLSFHHLDPSTKEKTIRKMCQYSMKRILQELKKGVVRCKNCHTIIHAGSSVEREEILIKQYINREKRYKTTCRNKLLIWEYKKTLSCIKCGIKDPVILLFHHINSEDKHKKISVLYKSGREVINREISKTICLCHNCHEEFHYIYGRKNVTQQKLENYIKKKVVPLQPSIEKYLSVINQNISEFKSKRLLF